MKPEQIDELLKRTLDDYKVSRGEKKILDGIVREHGSAPNQLAFLRHRAFDMAREQLMSPDAKGVLDWLEDVVKAFSKTEQGVDDESHVFFSPGDDCPNVISNLFERAEQTVDICVFTITDNRITQAIRDAYVRGINIRVITDNDKALDPGSDVDRMAGLGIPLRVDKSPHHMHHKYAIFDKTITLTGSYNWTRSADHHNEENFLTTEDPTITRPFIGHFEKLWDSLG